MDLSSKPRRAAEIARFMWMQRSGGFVVPDEPHLDEDGGREFRRLLSVATFYAEFGCGGSTVLAAQRGIPVISVESDPFFARAVAKRLPENDKVEILRAGIGPTVEWGYPFRRTPTLRWRAYVEAMYGAIRRRGRFPDFAMIDGRFRVACALSLARQAAEMSAALVILFDDYADRPHYHVIERTLGKPRLYGRAARFDLANPVGGITLKQVHDAIADPR